MRINKYLADCGLASRRKCDELIKEGKIFVNDCVLTNLGYDVKEKDKVQYNGQDIVLCKKEVYYMLNKPKGYMCTNSDEFNRKTIFELINNSDKRLFSIGRLDYNTEGLIIITNDGNLANKISHPSKEIEKEYIVKIEGSIKESELAVLRAGVVIDGERMPSAKVNIKKVENNQTRLSVIICQGQNRQIRRMFEAIGKNIVLLKRVRIGSLILGGLSRGQYRELSKEEISLLLGEF